MLQLPNGMWYNFRMQIILLYTLAHNALSHSSNWLHIQSIIGEMLEQCSSTVLTYNALAICTNNLTNNCDKYLTLWYSTYQYCYYGNEIMKVLLTYITCAVVIYLKYSPSGLRLLGSCIHIRQITLVHITYIIITCKFLHLLF